MDTPKPRLGILEFTESVLGIRPYQWQRETFCHIEAGHPTALSGTLTFTAAQAGALEELEKYEKLTKALFTATVLDSAWDTHSNWRIGEGRNAAAPRMDDQKTRRLPSK